MDKQIPRNILARLVFQEGHLQNEERVKSIVHEPNPCEYCGQMVEDRREIFRQYQSPVPHWRKRCVTCGLFWNPDTEKFDLTAHDSLAFFRTKYTRKDK